MKLRNIYFKTNDLLECVVKLVKFHKTQVGEKGRNMAKNQFWRVIEDQRISDQAWRRFEDQDTRLCLCKVLFFSLAFEFMHCITNDHCMALIFKILLKTCFKMVLYVKTFSKVLKLVFDYVQNWIWFIKLRKIIGQIFQEKNVLKRLKMAKLPNSIDRGWSTISKRSTASVDRIRLFYE